MGAIGAHVSRGHRQYEAGITQPVPEFVPSEVWAEAATEFMRAVRDAERLTRDDLGLAD